MAEYILAHDLGTSGNKASLFGTDGRLIASATENYPTWYEKEGRAEQNPADWWEAVCKATRRVLEGRSASDVAVIAVTGQMMGTVPIGGDGSLLGRSIIWSDARAGEECRILKQRVGEERYYRITGQPPSASYTLPKLMWYRTHCPDLYRNADCFLQAKDYINYRLTGHMATDHTDAAYTIAYDINKKCWSEELLEAAQVEQDKFPQVFCPDEILGYVTADAARECGLSEGIPVVVGAGDGSAAHLGAGCVETGDSYLCLGSSTWLVAQTERLVFDPKRRMQSEPHVIPGRYCYLGTMQTGGMAHSWARQNLAERPLDYSCIDKLVQEQKPGSGGMLFLPYLMGERSPWYDLDAKAAFLGIRQSSGYGAFYRAVMEGVAMNLNILLDVIRQQVDVPQVVAIGGGARSRAWCQILADVFDADILIPCNVESGTSIGGAIIAGVGCGIFPDYSVAKDFLQVGSVVKPRSEYTARYRMLQPIFEDAYQVLRDVNHRLGEILNES